MVGGAAFGGDEKARAEEEGAVLQIEVREQRSHWAGADDVASAEDKV